MAAVALSSCNNFDFEQNFYPHKVGLMAGNNRINDRTTVELSAVENGTASVQLVANLSGSQLADRDYHVTIAHDDSLFRAYNKSNFDIDSTKFARLLPKDCYEDPAMEGVIPSGTNKCLFDIKLKNLGSLSPDSTYFLNYKIVSHDASSLATDNNKLGIKLNHVLIKITWKNEFGSTADSWNYQLFTSQVTNVETKSTTRPTNTVRLFPVASNAVRFLAGDEKWDNYTKALHDINVKSIVAVIGKKTATNPAAREVALKPFKKDSIEVEMLTPVGDYDNTFLLNKIGVSASSNPTYFKEFRLHYRYRIMKNEKQKDGTWKSGPWKEVLTKMRYQFNPRSEKK